MQQPAEGLLEVVHLAHRVFAIAAVDPLDAEVGTLVALREPGEEIEGRGNIAAAGKVRKRAVRMAVELVRRFREETPRLERRALPVVQLIEHCLQLTASLSEIDFRELAATAVYLFSLRHSRCQ